MSVRKKSKFRFGDYLVSKKSRTTSRIRSQISQLNDEAIADNTMGGSRLSLLYQNAMSEGMSEYGEQILEVLSGHVSIHSPIRLKDFDLAIQSLIELEIELIEEYRGLKKRGQPFGSKFAEIDPSLIPSEREKLDDQLRFAKHTFKSKRSFTVSVLAKGKDQLSSLVVTGLFFLAGTVIEAMFGKFRALLDFTFF